LAFPETRSHSRDRYCPLIQPPPGVANSELEVHSVHPVRMQLRVEVQLGGEDGRHSVKVRGDDAHPTSKGMPARRLIGSSSFRTALISSRNRRRRTDGSLEEIDWEASNPVPALYGSATRAALGSIHRSNALAHEKTGEFRVATKMVN
jgi:hypothetical protein